MALRRIAMHLVVYIINLTGTFLWAVFGIRLCRFDEEKIWRAFTSEEKGTLIDPTGPDPNWVKLLSLSLQCWSNDPYLTTCGRLILKAMYIDRIRERLNVIRELSAQNPAQVIPICKPIFIVSINRSGSTHIQKLLARDPSNTAPLLWELIHTSKASCSHDNGQPFQETGYTNQIEYFYLLRPEYKKKNLLTPTVPHECYQIHQRSTVCRPFMVLGRNMDSYSTYVRALPREHLLEMYRFYKQQLQLILSGRKDKMPKTLILRDAIHPFFLGALLEVFPDAMFINTIRDPVEAVPSACSMLEDITTMIYQDTEVNRRRLGQRVLDHTVDCVSSLQKFRQENPTHMHRFIDVSYADLTRAPLVTMEKIYAKLGRTLSTEAKASMTTYLNQNPQHKHGHHVYSAEKYGLTNDEIRKKLNKFMQVGCERKYLSNGLCKH